MKQHKSNISKQASKMHHFAAAMFSVDVSHIGALEKVGHELGLVVISRLVVDYFTSRVG